MNNVQIIKLAFDNYNLTGAIFLARDYDPNKHCGVKTEPGNIHCTRSLTCKIHARSLKRKVTGEKSLILIIIHCDQQ